MLEQIHVEHYKNIVINNNSVLKSQTKHTDTHIEVSTKKKCLKTEGHRCTRTCN